MSYYSRVPVPASAIFRNRTNSIVGFRNTLFYKCSVVEAHPRRQTAYLVWLADPPPTIELDFWRARFENGENPTPFKLHRYTCFIRTGTTTLFLPHPIQRDDVLLIEDNSARYKMYPGENNGNVGSSNWEAQGREFLQ